jgi:peptide deformylase
MSFRKILEWPDPRLSQVSEPISDFKKEVESLVIDLEHTLRVKAGAGLAAPQIGVSKQAVIIDASQFNFDNPEALLSPLEDKNLWIILNPILSNLEGSMRWEEGCLSIPWQVAEVERSKSLTLEYQTLSGERKKVNLQWPISGAVQHECDHLQGKLILDRISRLRSRRIKNSIQKKRKKLASVRKSMLEYNEEKPIGRPKRHISLSAKEIKKRKKIKKNNR